MAQTPEVDIILLESYGLSRPCELCGVVGGWRQLKSDGRIHRRCRHTLYQRSVKFHGGLLESNHLRFSPVCEYMCVCSELGRVKRLSQTLHLCFFCVLDDTLELN